MALVSWQLSHLVNNSWWPLRIRISRFSLIRVTLIWFKEKVFSSLILFFLVTALLFLAIWLRDVIRESSFQGTHTSLVQGGLKWGLVWFLFREIWFFFRIFWRFFHFRLSPITRSLASWPRIGLTAIIPFQIPVLNTAILLIRGLTATLAHQELLGGKRTTWVLVRVLLGRYFLFLQAIEYYTRTYSIVTGAYGRVFFFSTGFHGIHVCLGAILLLVRNYRLILKIISSHHHFGLEFRLWYWHFVDVVWLFLFLWVYSWGN